MSNPLDRWEASIEAGKSAEAAILITFFQHLGLDLHDNTKDNVKNPDLRGECLLDSKILKSPYPAAKTPAGLEAGEHLTLDYINVMEDYPPNTMIVMTVDYTASGVPTKGLYFITAGRVREIVKQNPKRVYMRSNRTAKDKSKKIGISTKECGRIALPAMNMSASVDFIMAAQKHPLAEVVHPDVE